MARTSIFIIAADRNSESTCGAHGLAGCARGLKKRVSWDLKKQNLRNFKNSKIRKTK
jgi:hypothetical protein